MPEASEEGAMTPVESLDAALAQAKAMFEEVDEAGAEALFQEGAKGYEPPASVGDGLGDRVADTAGGAREQHGGSRYSHGSELRPEGAVVVLQIWCGPRAAVPGWTNREARGPGDCGEFASARG
jgi:hypothetical protein